jgi:hypothetical protein
MSTGFQQVSLHHLGDRIFPNGISFLFFDWVTSIIYIINAKCSTYRKPIIYKCFGAIFNPRLEVEFRLFQSLSQINIGRGPPDPAFSSTLQARLWFPLQRTSGAPKGPKIDAAVPSFLKPKR